MSLVPAFEAVSDYQFEGAPFLAVALAYLVLSGVVSLVDVDSGPPTDSNAGSAPSDGSGDDSGDSSPVRSDAGG